VTICYIFSQLLQTVVEQLTSSIPVITVCQINSLFREWNGRYYYNTRLQARRALMWFLNYIPLII